MCGNELKAVWLCRMTIQQVIQNSIDSSQCQQIYPMSYALAKIRSYYSYTSLYNVSGVGYLHSNALYCTMTHMRVLPVIREVLGFYNGTIFGINVGRLGYVF